MLASLIKVNGYSLMGISMLLVIVSMGLFGNAIHINNGSFTLREVINNMSRYEAREFGEHMNRLLLASTAPIMVGVWFGMIFTALGSLYDERKDSSILFWKSMPVSDTQTVMSKLLTVTVVIPLVAIGFALVFQIFLLIVGSLATFGTDHSAWNILWASSNLPMLLLNEIIYMLMYSLWALPIFAWFMLASVLAKRTPLLLAIVPVALIALFESLLFNTQYLIRFIGMHMTGAHLVDNNESLGRNLLQINSGTSLEIIGSAAEPAFWTGLGIAAAMLSLTIYLRRRGSL